MLVVGGIVANNKRENNPMHSSPRQWDQWLTTRAICDAKVLRRRRFDSSGKTPASCHDPAKAIASAQVRLPGAPPPCADGEPDHRNQEIEREW
jgi:hypothetical protein